MKSEGNAGPAVAARGTVDLPTEPAARPAHWPTRPDRTAWTSPIRRVPEDEQAAEAARAATAAAERAAAKATAAEDARQLAALRNGVTHTAISQAFKAAGLSIAPRTSPAQQSHEAALARREQLLPEIRRLFDEGLTHAAMAAALDVSEPYLKRILADLGLRRRQRLDGDEIVRLYVEERLGIERIARQLRTAQQAIRYHLLKRGVPIRGRHDTKRLADERPDLHARALEMLRAGEPAMTVAAALHVGASTVARWRDAAGIAARASGHRRDAQAADDGEPSPAAARQALLDALLVERFGPRPPRPQSRRPPVARVAADPLPETARRRRALAEADDAHAEEARDAPEKAASTC